MDSHKSKGDQVLEELLKGNKRFSEGRMHLCTTSSEERKKLLESQSPIATIVACSDSRVSPELAFDQPIGRLFVVRDAGNVVDTNAKATVEFGVTVLGTPLVIVMGHQSCGAVQAAFSLGKVHYSSALTSLLTSIHPSVEHIRKFYPTNEKEWNVLATKEHAKRMARQLKEYPPIQEAVRVGKTKVVAAFSSLETGKVEIIPYE